MSTVEEQILAVEKEIKETPYDKSTERHHGMLRAKLARLKDKQVEVATRKSGGGGGYAVKKQGDATIVLVGPPSAGKSTLINKLTNAASKVAPYAFTTLTVIPGMLKYKNAYIQVLDVPGLIEGAEAGKGRGREVLSVVRGSDLLVMITDPERISTFDTMSHELEAAGIRINKTPPDVRIDKKPGGGLAIYSNIRQDIDRQTIKDVATEFGVKNGEVTIKEKLTMETLVDAFATNRVYIPAIYVVNKVDDGNLKFKIKNYEVVPISAEKNIGLEELKAAIWSKLNLSTVYLVKRDEAPSFNNPMIMHNSDTLKNVAMKIGSEFAENREKAKIWGKGAKFPGQEVSLTTRVQEGMQIRFV